MPSTNASAQGSINQSFEWVGELGIFVSRTVRAVASGPFEGRELIRQIDEMGSKSFPLVALAGGAIGAVLSFESRGSLVQFGAKAMLPAAVVFAIIHEMGPIVTGLIVSGRVGAGIGAELGSMKVTEQIDAIEASAVNPYNFLAVPRILACMLVLPLLTLASDFFAVLMAWVADTLAEPISFQSFIHSGFGYFNFNGFLAPTFKTLFFGLIIGLVACYQGMKTRGGTAGVGRTATSSVVLSSLFVILADVILAKAIVIFFP